MKDMLSFHLRYMLDFHIFSLLLCFMLGDGYLASPLGKYSSERIPRKVGSKAHVFLNTLAMQRLAAFLLYRGVAFLTFLIPITICFAHLYKTGAPRAPSHYRIGVTDEKT